MLCKCTIEELLRGGKVLFAGYLRVGNAARNPLDLLDICFCRISASQKAQSEILFFYKISAI